MAGLSLFGSRASLIRYRAPSALSLFASLLAGLLLVAVVLRLAAGPRGSSGVVDEQEMAARLPWHAHLANSSSWSAVSQAAPGGGVHSQGIYLRQAGVHQASFWHSPVQLAAQIPNMARLMTFVAEIPPGCVRACLACPLVFISPCSAACRSAACPPACLPACLPAYPPVCVRCLCALELGSARWL